MRHEWHDPKYDDYMDGQERVTDCTIKCTCGTVFTGSARYDGEALAAARQQWYEHLHAVRANRAEMVQERVP